MRYLHVFALVSAALVAASPAAPPKSTCNSQCLDSYNECVAEDLVTECYSRVCLVPKCKSCTFCIARLSLGLDGGDAGAEFSHGEECKDTSVCKTPIEVTKNDVVEDTEPPTYEVSTGIESISEGASTSCPKQCFADSRTLCGSPMCMHCRHCWGARKKPPTTVVSANIEARVVVEALHFCPVSCQIPIDGCEGNIECLAVNCKHRCVKCPECLHRAENLLTDQCSVGICSLHARCADEACRTNICSNKECEACPSCTQQMSK
ncbi:unnamed protein product [Periconia digitata]|uniref:RING-type domain-containing protein n=1 Tax=Periconia digitata TaxID=1303443 RepID=A0A9W4UM60_9PLEO|nr:unnamed protein product [Periconia digitata]